MEITVTHTSRTEAAYEWAARMISANHYLHRMPDPRTSLEVFLVRHPVHVVPAGVLVFGRPEATRCADWYGSVQDQQSGKCQVTRWQIINLSRVWIHPDFQTGGRFCRFGVVPGYMDRHRVFRSTFASAILRTVSQQIGYDYLRHRPPCFLDEPYGIAWMLSYCNTSLHHGTIYRASGFELYRTNSNGIQTWRIPIPSLTTAQDAHIRTLATHHPRSIAYRGRRSQLALF